MKYTKEQAEMLFLLVVMGCAVVVLSFLYLVKPNFAAMANSRKELSKTEAEIAKVNTARPSLLKARNERDTLTDTVERGEKAVFSGLETDPALYDVCVQAATKVNLKPAHGKETLKDLLEFKERGEDGKPIVRHYSEVGRTLDLSSADFFAVCRFLSAVENANEGLSVTQFEITNTTLGTEEQEQGKANAKFELSMVGIRELERSSDPIDISGYKDFDVGGKRNPFGPPGGSMAPIRDPLGNIKNVLSRTKITGVWSDTLLVDVPERGTTGQDTYRNIAVTKGQSFVIAGVKLQWVSVSGDTFVFEAPDNGVRFKLITRGGSGDIVTVKEEEAK
jgi:type II secretory pathway component PulM